MKEKILLALKTACGTTTSISDKTLDKIAETLATTITEESQIEAAIELQKPILQAIDGNINFVAAEAVKKVKPVEKTQEKQVEKTADPNDLKTLIAEAINAAINPLQEKLNGYEKEKTQTQLTSKITAKLKEKGIPESYLKGRNLLIESEDGIDTLVNSIDADYTGFKQEMAEQGVIISAPKSSAGGLKEGEALGQAIADRRNTGSSEGIKGKEIK